MLVVSIIIHYNGHYDYDIDDYYSFFPSSWLKQIRAASRKESGTIADTCQVIETSLFPVFRFTRV
jgi:hypothetical protein